MNPKIEVDKVISTFLRKDVVLSEKEREDWGVVFGYIENKSREIQDIHYDTVRFSENISDVHKSCLDLHKKVDMADQKYRKLGAALGRWKKAMTTIQDVCQEEEVAWDKMKQVEEKLLEHPLFAAMKGGHSVDSLLFE